MTNRKKETEDPSEKDLDAADQPRQIQYMEVWRARSMVPNEFYIRASRWLQKVLDKLILKPIAPQRLAAFHSRLWRELSNRASDHKTMPYYELYAEAAAALNELLPGEEKVWMNIPSSLFDPADSDAPKAQEYVLKVIHHQINKKVTESILGEGWWRAEKERPFKEDDFACWPKGDTGQRFRKGESSSIGNEGEESNALADSNFPEDGITRDLVTESKRRSLKGPEAARSRGSMRQITDPVSLNYDEELNILECFLLNHPNLTKSQKKLSIKLLYVEQDRKNGAVPEAARQLGISPSTARNELRSIRKNIPRSQFLKNLKK